MNKDQLITFIIATLELDSTSIRQDQIENVDKLIDQYAYEYAESVIGAEESPAKETSGLEKLIHQDSRRIEWRNEFRSQQRKTNRELSSHGEERSER